MNSSDSKSAAGAGGGGGGGGGGRGSYKSSWWQTSYNHAYGGTGGEFQARKSPPDAERRLHHARATVSMAAVIQFRL